MAITRSRARFPTGPCSRSLALSRARSPNASIFSAFSSTRTRIRAAVRRPLRSGRGKLATAQNRCPKLARLASQVEACCTPHDEPGPEPHPPFLPRKYALRQWEVLTGSSRRDQAFVARPQRRPGSRPTGRRVGRRGADVGRRTVSPYRLRADFRGSSIGRARDC